MTTTTKSNGASTQELVDHIAAKTDSTKASVREALGTVIAAIRDVTEENGRLQIADLGVFTVKEHAARTGRNPQSGQPMEIGARKAVSFKPAKAFKDQIA